MRFLRLLPLFRRPRGPGSKILPLDPAEQKLLDRQRAARGIRSTQTDRKDNQ